MDGVGNLTNFWFFTPNPDGDSSVEVTVHQPENLKEILTFLPERFRKKTANFLQQIAYEYDGANEAVIIDEEGDLAYIQYYFYDVYYPELISDLVDTKLQSLESIAEDFINVSHLLFLSDYWLP